jgi:ribose transport system substrate-binding protein
MATKIRRIGAGAAACALAAAALAACGSSNSTKSESATKPASTTPASAAQPASPLVAGLPPELKSQYVGLASPVHPSGFKGSAAAKKPWKVCYSESFVGNPWRVALANEMKRLAAEYKSAGLVSSFTMSVSDNDVARQNQQIRQFADQGCSIIYVVAGSATGLNQAIKAATDKGIAVVTIAGSVTAPSAINVDSNYYVLGQDLAQAIVKSGAKNVLMVKGIAGSPIAVQQNEGADAVWKENGTNVVAEVNGNWTPSVTKQVVLRALATHPGKVDAVWTTGSESAVIAQAFKQAGRPEPLITASISGDALGYWKQNPKDFKFTGVALMPSWTAETGWRVGMRALAGKGPKLNTLMVPVPQVTQSMLPQLYEPCMKPDSASVFPVMPSDPLPGNLMDAYFAKPGEVGPYDYSKIPSACA